MSLRLLPVFLICIAPTLAETVDHSVFAGELGEIRRSLADLDRLAGDFRSVQLAGGELEGNSPDVLGKHRLMRTEASHHLDDPEDDDDHNAITQTGRIEEQKLKEEKNWLEKQKAEIAEAKAKVDQEVSRIAIQRMKLERKKHAHEDVSKIAERIAEAVNRRRSTHGDPDQAAAQKALKAIRDSQQAFGEEHASALEAKEEVHSHVPVEDKARQKQLAESFKKFQQEMKAAGEQVPEISPDQIVPPVHKVFMDDTSKIHGHASATNARSVMSVGMSAKADEAAKRAKKAAAYQKQLANEHKDSTHVDQEPDEMLKTNSSDGLGQCIWNVQIARQKGSGPSVMKTMQIKGGHNESFYFDGCTHTGPEAQICTNTDHAVEGVRVLKNEQHAVVGYGSCCKDGLLDKIIQVTKSTCTIGPPTPPLYSEHQLEASQTTGDPAVSLTTAAPPLFKAAAPSQQAHEEQHESVTTTAEEIAEAASSTSKQTAETTAVGAHRKSTTVAPAANPADDLAAVAAVAVPLDSSGIMTNVTTDNHVLGYSGSSHLVSDSNIESEQPDDIIKPVVSPDTGEKAGALKKTAAAAQEIDSLTRRVEVAVLVLSCSTIVLVSIVASGLLMCWHLEVSKRLTGGIHTLHATSATFLGVLWTLPVFATLGVASMALPELAVVWQFIEALLLAATFRKMPDLFVQAVGGHIQLQLRLQSIGESATGTSDAETDDTAPDVSEPMPEARAARALHVFTQWPFCCIRRWVSPRPPQLADLRTLQWSVVLLGTVLPCLSFMELFFGLEGEDNASNFQRRFVDDKQLPPFLKSLQVAMGGPIIEASSSGGKPRLLVTLRLLQVLSIAVGMSALSGLELLVAALKPKAATDSQFRSMQTYCQCYLAGLRLAPGLLGIFPLISEGQTREMARGFIVCVSSVLCTAAARRAFPADQTHYRELSFAQSVSKPILDQVRFCPFCGSTELELEVHKSGAESAACRSCCAHNVPLHLVVRRSGMAGGTSEGKKTRATSTNMGTTSSTSSEGDKPTHY